MKCSICKEEKEIELFSKDRCKKSGYRLNCKACENIRKKIYYHEKVKKNKIKIINI